MSPIRQPPGTKQVSWAAARGSAGSPGLVQRSASAPASPLEAARLTAALDVAQGQQQQRNALGKVPAPSNTPRMNKTAEVRAANVRRQLQQREQRANAYLAYSPSPALRDAAAAGLSLRELASPHRGVKSQGRTQTPWAMAGALAAGEAGVEPRSARMPTAEKRRMRQARVSRPSSGGAPPTGVRAVRGSVRPEPAQQAAAGPPADRWMAAQAAEAAGGPTVDVRQYEAQRAEYLQMLHKLVSACPTQLEIALAESVVVLCGAGGPEWCLVPLSLITAGLWPPV